MLHVAEHFEQTDTGRQRRENEDNFFARAPLFVVADGMGGAQAGEVASRVAAEAFAAGLPDEGTVEQRLAARVLAANREIHELSRADRERAGMGTTLTAAYLDGDELAIAHVGDSRAYLWRDGELTRLTRDHSLVDELVRRGKLTEEEAAEHPQRSIITRALGPEPDVEVDTMTHPLQDGDVLLLCSDGLTAMVSEPRIAELLHAASGLCAAGRALVEDANAAGGRDNITVLLFRVAEGDQDGAVDEQPTRVRAGEALAAGEVRSALAAAQGTATSAPAAAGAPPTATVRTPTATARSPRVVPARREGADRAHAPLPRRVKLLAGTVATVVVLGVIVVAGWIATRGVFFVSTNGQGMVTVYRGLPWSLPAGLNLYEKYYVSGVPASDVPAARRASLFDHRLRSRGDVQSLVAQLELGKLAP